jgi:flagellar hook-basal body complex protein FliE
VTEGSVTIPAVGSLGSLGSLASLNIQPVTQAGAADAANATAAAGSTSNDFGNAIVNALDNLQGTQNNADQLAIQASTGNLTDVTDYLIASNQAQVQTQLTTAVRDKAVEAFQSIMGMQV